MSSESTFSSRSSTVSSVISFLRLVFADCECGAELGKDGICIGPQLRCGPRGWQRSRGEPVRHPWEGKQFIADRHLFERVVVPALAASQYVLVTAQLAGHESGLFERCDPVTSR